jgi:hypothetical protein
METTTAAFSFGHEVIWAMICDAQRMNLMSAMGRNLTFCPTVWA